MDIKWVFFDTFSPKYLNFYAKKNTKLASLAKIVKCDFFGCFSNTVVVLVVLSSLILDLILVFLICMSGGFSWAKKRLVEMTLSGDGWLFLEEESNNNLL